MPLTGSHPSHTAKPRISSKASQNWGMEIPSNTTRVSTRSCQPRRCAAAIAPAARPRTVASVNAVAASSKVGPMRSAISSTTGLCSVIERPRSPCNTLPSHMTKRFHSGWSRPSSARNDASASGVAKGPRIASAGSPGSSAIIRNTTSEIPSSTGINWIRRRRMYRVMPQPCRHSATSKKRTAAVRSLRV